MITEETIASYASPPVHDAESVVRKGEAIYRQIRAEVETPETIGDYLIIETVSGEWEIVPDDGDRLAHRLFEKGPAVGRFMTRIGYTTFAAKGTRLSRRDD